MFGLLTLIQAIKDRYKGATTSVSLRIPGGNTKDFPITIGVQCAPRVECEEKYYFLLEELKISVI